MKLSVIIPVYNEIDTIEDVLSLVREAPGEKEIIVADDCSTDGSREYLRTVPDIMLIENEYNIGKGASIRRSLEHVSGEIVIIQDADLEYDPMDFLKMIQPILDGVADMVYGTRFVPHKPKMRLLNYIANRVFAWIATVLYGVKITDEATCYKAFRTEVIKSLDLHCTRFEFCPEVTGRLLKRGYRYCEVPVSYHPRTYAQGKKITWRDGITCIWTLVKYRFVG
jgi:dolichol-phosphate mannosyltransferase